MGFLERLRGYLDRVERAPEGLPVIHVDVAAHRQHFAEASDPVMERALNRAISPAEERMEQREERLQKLVEELRQRRESLPVFVEEVADHILETLAPSASQEEVTKLINVAINRGLWDHYESMTGSRGLDEEMLRIAELARARIEWRNSRDGWESPARYAFEIRAIARKHADRHTLTRSGAAFLGLSGIDAVRWLLALESAQSLGPMDEWRISSELAAQLLAEPERDIAVENLLDGSWRFSLPTIRRLEAMRLLHYEDQDLNRGRRNFSYAVFDRARPLLEEIAEQRPTPFAVLADALLRDEVARTLDDARPGAERALHDSAAAATALQAKMVVHEVRNALIAGVAADLNGSLRYAPPDRALSMTGPRARFVLAVTNLLRNAAQAVMGREGVVEVSIEERENSVAVHVDDNGPGIPVEQRDTIFKAGVTFRPGGSGQGLALV